MSIQIMQKTLKEGRSDPPESRCMIKKKKKGGVGFEAAVMVGDPGRRDSGPFCPELQR